MKWRQTCETVSWSICHYYFSQTHQSSSINQSILYCEGRSSGNAVHQSLHIQDSKILFCFNIKMDDGEEKGKIKERSWGIRFSLVVTSLRLTGSTEEGDTETLDGKDFSPGEHQSMNTPPSSLNTGKVHRSSFTGLKHTSKNKQKNPVWSFPVSPTPEALVNQKLLSSPNTFFPPACSIFSFFER